MPADTVYFVHITDTHFGTTADYQRNGLAPYPCAEKLVDLINHLPVRPDFVIHTGDVTTHPDPAAYERAAEVFSRLEVPIYYAVGNHDTAVSIRHYLPMGAKQELNHDLLSYTFEVKGYRFLVVDARGPDNIDPHGLLSPTQLRLIQQEATPDGPPLTIFMHYPIWPLNSPWMDENMLILNGAAMHQALLPARARLRGVFHGHVHQAMQTVRDGIFYVAGASAFAQFTAWPTDTEAQADPTYLPAYQFVHLLPEQTIIHQHTFFRP